MPKETPDPIVSDSKTSLPILLNELFDQYEEFHQYNAFLCAAFESLIFHMNFHTDFLDDATSDGAALCCQTLQKQSNEIKIKLDKIQQILAANN